MTRASRPWAETKDAGNGAHAPPEVDATDLAIIELLRQNGRITNQAIAEALSITPATVAARIRRLEDSQAMRVVAISDFSAHGLNILLAIGIDVHGRPAAEVAQDLAAFPEVVAVHLSTGRHDIEILVALGDYQEIGTFLHEHVGKVAGVDRLDPGIAVDVAKYEFNVAPL